MTVREWADALDASEAETCEWTDINMNWHGCTNKYRPMADPLHWTFCPYCGRRVTIKEAKP